MKLNPSVRAKIEGEIGVMQAERQALADATPKVLDGHSDGRRVRYVKLETSENALRWVLDLFDKP